MSGLSQKPSNLKIQRFYSVYIFICHYNSDALKIGMKDLIARSNSDLFGIMSSGKHIREMYPLLNLTFIYM